MHRLVLVHLTVGVVVQLVLTMKMILVYIMRTLWMMWMV